MILTGRADWRSIGIAIDDLQIDRST